MLDWYRNDLRFHDCHLCVREHIQKGSWGVRDARARAIEHSYETCAPRGKAASAIRRRSAIRSIEENVADSLRWLQLPQTPSRRSSFPRAPTFPTISPEISPFDDAYSSPSFHPLSRQLLRRGWLRSSTLLLHSASGCRAYNVMTQEHSARNSCEHDEVISVPIGYSAWRASLTIDSFARWPRVCQCCFWLVFETMLLPFLILFWRNKVREIAREVG